MNNAPSNEFDHISQPQWTETAAEICAHWIVIRGGGSFLSSSDAERLLTWLERGYTVPQIVFAMELGAKAKRKNASRLPLTFGRIQRYLKPLPVVALRTTVESVAFELEKRNASHWANALRSVPPGELQEWFRQLLHIARACLEEQWNIDTVRHGLLQRAEQILSELDLGYDEHTLPDAVESLARDDLRREWPMLEAEILWSAIVGEPK